MTVTSIYRSPAGEDHRSRVDGVRLPVGFAQMQPAQHYPEPTAGALILDPEGRLFLKWADKYVLPGGHVELGETLAAALRREVVEDTDLAIHDIRFVCMQEFIYDPALWQPRYFIYLDSACHTVHTKVQLNDELEEYVWGAVDEALRLPIEPYAAKAIRTYLAGQNAE